MHLVTPQVKLITGITLDRVALQSYLDNVGATDYTLPDAGTITDEELLVEIMGRLCYKSWQPDLNPNITRVRTDSAAYIENLLKSRHGSVLEHVNLSFIFSNVSRVFTHELVRHRVGVAISQESMRYLRLTDIPIWIPSSVSTEIDEAQEFYEDVAATLHLQEALQEKWVSRFELDKSKSFEHKKRMTSALRRFFSPTGVATEIGWTCNVRELRHTIQLRTSLAAEEEIRQVFNDVALIVTRQFPFLFGDLRYSKVNEWWSPFDHPEIAMKKAIQELIGSVFMSGDDMRTALQDIVTLA